MAKQTSNTRKKRGGGVKADPQNKARPKQGRAAAEKRLNAVFDALTEELLTSLEHNYEPKER